MIPFPSCLPDYCSFVAGWMREISKIEARDPSVYFIYLDERGFEYRRGILEVVVRARNSKIEDLGEKADKLSPESISACRS